MRNIKISEGIKGEIAEKVTTQASAGYSKGAQGEWFVVNGTSVQHKEQTAAWVPWSDDADVISVDDLVFIYGGAEAESADFENGLNGADDYDITVEFALGYVPSSYDAADYEAREG
jgi:hypothetical protein